MKKITTYILLLLYSASCFSQNADIDLLKEINLNRNKSLDPTFRFITNTATPLSFATPIIIFSVGLIKKDSTIKSKVFYLGETFLVAAFISTALKYSVNRDRPFVTYPFIEKASSGGISRLFKNGFRSSLSK